MIKKLALRPSHTVVALVTPLALAILAYACSASEHHESDGVFHKPPPGWQMVCLHRFLIDLPGPIEMGSTSTRYLDAHGFEGIDDIGGKGASWGKLQIAESLPTNVAGYEVLYRGAAARVTSPAIYKAGIQAREEDVRHWAIRAKSGSAAEIASAMNILNERQKDLDASKHGLKVSGVARLSEEHAFALRRGDEYSAGYLDAVDQRVRIFEGAVSNLPMESSEAAALELRRLRGIYHRRAPTDIPTTPGFCTGFGLIDEASGPTLATSIELPFRSLKYPNLLFRLSVVPADQSGKRSIQDLPGMNAEKSDLHLVGITGTYGPVKANILGAPARSVGYEYGPNCMMGSCRPVDQAYEIEAETFGEAGRTDRPHLILHMIAATSDDYKLKRQPEPRDPSFDKPSRPSLSGQVPPPFDEGKKIFEQVLRSIRLRPGAIATTGTAPR